MSMYRVYMMECKDKSLYTGITTDINRRIQEHNNGTASKYTRCRLPVYLFWLSKFECPRSLSMRLIKANKC